MNIEIKNKFNNHVHEATTLFNSDNIIGVFLAGSQNYGIDTKNSDIDSKVLLVPSFEDIALNKKLKSGTHVLSNQEHMSYKDIRLYMDTLRKQNINFIEILFTDYFYVNSLYQEAWTLLLENREAIAYYNPYRAVLAMCGQAERNYKLITHKTETNAKYFDKYGYYPKAFAHLERMYESLIQYIMEYPYKEVLTPLDKNFIIKIKNGCFNKTEVLSMAEESYNKMMDLKIAFLSNHKDEFNLETDKILQEASKRFLKISLQNEFCKDRMEEIVYDRCRKISTNGRKII